MDATTKFFMILKHIEYLAIGILVMFEFFSTLVGEPAMMSNRQLTLLTLFVLTNVGGDILIIRAKVTPE